MICASHSLHSWSRSLLRLRKARSTWSVYFTSERLLLSSSHWKHFESLKMSLVRKENPSLTFPQILAFTNMDLRERLVCVAGGVVACVASVSVRFGIFSALTPFSAQAKYRKSRSSVFLLCSQTPWKRLLRRLAALAPFFSRLRHSILFAAQNHKLPRLEKDWYASYPGGSVILRKLGAWALLQSRYRFSFCVWKRTGF